MLSPNLTSGSRNIHTMYRKAKNQKDPKYTLALDWYHCKYWAGPELGLGLYWAGPGLGLGLGWLYSD